MYVCIAWDAAGTVEAGGGLPAAASLINSSNSPGGGLEYECIPANVRRAVDKVSQGNVSATWTLFVLSLYPGGPWQNQMPSGIILDEYKLRKKVNRRSRLCCTYSTCFFGFLPAAASLMSSSNSPDGGCYLAEFLNGAQVAPIFPSCLCRTNTINTQ